MKAWREFESVRAARKARPSSKFSMLNALVGAATSHNVSYVTAIYLPTPKNSMVAGHYDSLGFIRTSVAEDSAIRYRLSLSDYIAPILPFRISE
jgi:hypothetical protein